MDALVNNEYSTLIIDAIKNSEMQEFDTTIFEKIALKTPHIAKGETDKLMRRIAVL